jgi:Protein of unknown function (DUF1566)/Divergent InlB B-repeat domain
MSQPKEKLIGQFSQFIDHQDGTVTDTGTGLMWKRMAEKTESPTIAETFSFKQATAIQSDFAGYLDWRLPSIDELGSLLDIRLRPLTFDESVFTGKPKCFFWSSTIHANGSVLSALTRMMYGDSIGYGDMTNQVEYVRLVRNPSSLPFSLTVLKSGAGTGEVHREPYASTYEPGRVVRLTAAAQLGSRFVGWHGDAIGGHFVNNLRMDSAKTVTAEFDCIEDAEHSHATRQTLVADTGTLQQLATNQEKKFIGRFGHFIDHCDGTVTDIRSDLMWKRMSESAVGNGGITETFSFSQASAMRNDFAGYPDWRLPSIEELRSLFDSRLKPMLDDSVFAAQQGCYFWSSTLNSDPKSGFNGYAWVTKNESGSPCFGNTQADAEHVRLVRRAIRPELLTGNSAVSLHKAETLSSVQQRETKQVIQGVSVLSSAFVTNGDAIGTPKKSLANPIGDFRDNGDGTVTDARTGLMWMRAAVGQTWAGGTANGDASYHSFESALKFPSTFAGYDDWRLPTLSELELLVIPGLQAPTIDIYAFPNTSRSLFWSSSHVDERGSNNVFKKIDQNVWRVDFRDGIKNPASPTAYALIRLVRECNSLRFSLAVSRSGTGSGSVVRDIKAYDYPFGKIVSLTALAAEGSKFIAWKGDAIGSNAICAIRMDSSKTVSAVFDRPESFALGVSLSGTGTGVITYSLVADEYVQGTTVTLTASAAIGSKFKSWSGDETGQATVCNVTMNSAKTVSAEFVQLESFVLNVNATGTGSGIITRSLDAETYFYGDSVILTAQAAEGSIFSRWLGDATGLEDVCTVQMNAAKLVTAEFEKVSVPDFGVALEFESAKDAQMKSGDAAVIFNLSIFNKGGKQIRIELPLATYVNRLGEEIEQSVWLSGLVIGSDGSTIRAGTFRKMGLVFFNSRLAEVSKGDRLYVTAVQLKPAKRICFTMMCTDAKSRAFMVVNAASEEQQETPESVETSLAMVDVLQRIAVLEEGMANLLRILDATPRDSVPAVADTTSKPIHAHTLQLVLTWLASQDRISIAAFRTQLLPLDMLPGAVINEINERALDLIGEIGLDEVDDQILVIKNVFDEVLANWNFTQS